MSDINWLTVLIAAFASMVIGGIWFGPLFGKTFLSASGMDKWSPEQQAEAKKSMMTSYVLQFVASIVMFAVLNYLMVGLDQVSLKGGISSALLAWIGLVIPVQLSTAIWGGNRTIFFLTAGNMLVTLVAAGAIIGAWS